jgi:NADH:ubiquinone oxidoreductase subunit K
MEVTILTIVVAVLDSIVGLALVVLPLRFTDRPGEDPALDDVRA